MSRHGTIGIIGRACRLFGVCLAFVLADGAEAESLLGRDPCPGVGLATTASDGAAMDSYGSSVSMSGDLVVVGAPFDDDGRGKVYVYRRKGLELFEEEAMLTTDPRNRIDYFGGSVSISGNTIVVGARFDDERARDAGAAYVFEKIDGMWRRTAKLTAPDGDIEDHFGSAVSISGDTIAIGAPRDDDNGRNSGSVYIFIRAGDGWSLLTKLAPRSTQVGSFFGLSLHLKQNRLIIGAPLTDARDINDDSGAIYIYEKMGNFWRLGIDGMPNPSRERDGNFGLSVSIDGNRAIVGAPGDLEGRGRAYILIRSTVFGITLWIAEDTLTASDGQRNDQFGTSVSLDGDLAVVGAVKAQILGQRSGAAYVFRRSQKDDEWQERVKLSARDGEDSAYFGKAVFLEGREISVGAPDDDNENGDHAGGVYMFPVEPEPCCADLDRNGILDADDFFFFLDLFKSRNPHANFVEDERFDAADFFRYSDLFDQGCP